MAVVERSVLDLVKFGYKKACQRKLANQAADFLESPEARYILFGLRPSVRTRLYELIRYLRTLKPGERDKNPIPSQGRSAVWLLQEEPIYWLDEGDYEIRRWKGRYAVFDRDGRRLTKLHSKRATALAHLRRITRRRKDDD